MLTQHQVHCGAGNMQRFASYLVAGCQSLAFGMHANLNSVTWCCTYVLCGGCDGAKFAVVHALYRHDLYISSSKVCNTSQPLYAERHDSIEADSIVKSAKKADPTLSLGDSDSALGQTGSVSKTDSGVGLDKAASLLTQQKAVAGSIDHIADHVVTSAKSGAMTDPEQAFTQRRPQYDFM